jgi:hypothetical protein
MRGFVIFSPQCLSKDKIKDDEFHEKVASIEDMKTAYKVLGVNPEAERTLVGSTCR